MKKKAKVDWKKVWKKYRLRCVRSDLYYIFDIDANAIEHLVESQLSHKSKKVKGRK